MGCIYTGFKSKNYVHGVYKIGMTSFNTPAERARKCKIDIIHYMRCPNAHKVELLLLESIARYVGWKMGMEHFGNDYFHYNVEKGNKNKQAELIAVEILSTVAKVAETLKIDYELI